MWNKYNRPARIKPAAIKYLYEFAAIPLQVRKNYLKKLLTCPVTGRRRKNADLQKNVMLLKLIYRHITGKDMMKWNEGKVCKSLGITKGMLYCHKSRLLRGLRSFYFKWDKIENEEFAVKRDVPENDMSIQFKKAERMFDLGMKREAKNIFFKLEKDLNFKKCAGTEEKLLLFNVCFHLSHYYSYLKKRIRFNIYYKKTFELGYKLLRIRSIREIPDIRSEILIRIYQCTGRKRSFGEDSFEQWENSIIILKKALAESKNLTGKVKNIKLQAELLFLIARLHIFVKKESEAAGYIMEGLQLTSENSLYPEYLSFKSLQHTIDFINNKITPEYAARLILSYYKKITSLKTFPGTQVIRRILAEGGRIASAGSDRNLMYYLQYKYNSYCIMEAGLNHPSIFTMLYNMKFYYYSDNLQEISFRNGNENEDEYLYVSGINEYFMEKLMNAFDEIMLNFPKICNVYFKKSIYLFMLETEFWKGKDADPERIQYLINRVHWLDRSRGKLSEFNKSAFERLRFAAKAVEEFKYLSRKDFIYKYEQKFNEFAGNLLNGDIPASPSDYFILSHLAEQTGYKELKEVIKKVYFRLQEKNPCFFTPLIEEMKKRNSRNHRQNPSYAKFNPEDLEKAA